MNKAGREKKYEIVSRRELSSPEDLGQRYIFLRVISTSPRGVISTTCTVTGSARLVEAMAKTVWLKSGANLVIEQTESLTAIDVNTGKCTLTSGGESGKAGKKGPSASCSADPASCRQL